MQDRYRHLDKIHLQRTAGPYIRVKTGKAHYEHMFSALPPKADSGRTSRDVRFVPDSVLIMRRRRRPVFLRDRKDTACGAVARPMRYFDLAAKVVGPPGRGR
jgi:hypothetical protein